MNKLMEKINGFFTSLGASGATWQLTLCVLLSLVVSSYIVSHNGRQYGHEWVQLDKTQLNTINKYLVQFPDDTLKTQDSVRQQRNQLLMLFINKEYFGKVDSAHLALVNSLLSSTPTKDCLDVLTSTKIKCKSFFWLSDSYVYIEALFWSMMGVLVSLIYYVSLANSRGSNLGGDDDAGTFNPSQVPSQIAKLFYAPACTIVLILGYHYLSDKSGNMVDISVNKGLIVFAFIAGFFSGRVMKFLDRLKELLLPYSPTAASTSNSTAATTTDVTVALQLSEALSQSTHAAAIAEAGFNAATVTLTNSAGQVIALTNPTEDQSDAFLAKAIPTGKYTLKAFMSHTADDDSILNLAGETTIDITSANPEIVLELKLTDSLG